MPDVIAEHNALWHGISLWSVWVSCPGRFPSKLPALRGAEWEKGLDAVQALSSNS